MIADEDIPQTNSDYVEDLTGEIAVERPHLAIAIGERLRDLREKKVLTLNPWQLSPALILAFLPGSREKRCSLSWAR